MIPVIILFAGFCIATYTDLKRREIPISLFPTCIVAYIVYAAVTGITDWENHFLGAVIMFFPFLAGCLAGKMGGGDLIMLTAAGFILGFPTLTIYILCLGITGTVLSIFLLVTHKQTDSVPYAPLAFISYLIYLGGVFIVSN